MRAAIAMRADVNHEGAGFDGDFVGAEVEDEIERAGLRHRARIQPARARREAEIERADARGRRMQDREAVPAVAETAEPLRGLSGERERRLAVVARQSALPDDDEQLLSRLCGADELQTAIPARPRDSRSRR